MARKKVQLAWIANNSTRNSTLRKRKSSLMKKASELATLCGIKVCVIVFGPEQQQQPDVWPSMAEAVDTLVRLRGMSETDQCKKMMDQEGFLRQGLSKLVEQVRRSERENGELESELLMYQCLSGRKLEDVGAEDVRRLSWTVDTKLKLVNDRLGRAGGTVSFQDVATPAAGVDVGLTMAMPQETLPTAQEEGRGSQRLLNVAPERTPMEAAMEELQLQNCLKGKNPAAADSIWMNPRMHSNWQMHALSKEPLEELRTQDFMLEKMPVQYLQSTPDHWLMQARGKAPMESAMKEPQGYYRFVEQRHRTPAEEALERFQQQQYLMAEATMSGHGRYNCLTEPASRGKAPQETPVAPAMDMQSLLMLQCPSMAAEALRIHDWPMVQMRENAPSVESAMQVLERQSWNRGAAMNVPRQSTAFDGGEGMAPTGYSQQP